MNYKRLNATRDATEKIHVATWNKTYNTTYLITLNTTRNAAIETWDVIDDATIDFLNEF